MSDILATSPDLKKIIEKSVKRIGENHALARDNNGVTMKANEIEEDRKEFRKETEVIEEALKAVADEMAEKMVLENTIDNMVKDVIGGQPKDNNPKSTVNETTTEAIKKLVNKKLRDKIVEAEKKHPGLDAYEKAAKKSKAETNEYQKDTKKKFEEYSDFNGDTDPSFPHQEGSKTSNEGADGQHQYYRNDSEDQEFIDDFAYPGLQDFDIHNTNMDRLSKYLEGSQETGNAQVDKDGELLGNVGYKSELGEKLAKSAKRRKEKIEANKSSMTNLKGYTPDVQKVKQVKEGVMEDMDNMKKLWNYHKNTQ